MDQIITCPHCNDFIIIKELNCGIFRHATLKTTGEQIDPHSTKEVCENYIKNDLIYGCGKPFQIIISQEGVLEIQICEYI
jgi:hypothetical protein